MILNKEPKLVHEVLMKVDLILTTLFDDNFIETIFKSI